MDVLGQGEHLRLLRSGGYEYCSRLGITGIVAIVAMTDNDEIVLVEQDRPPVGGRVVEIPAGLAGDHGEESLARAARRELLEETGFEAERWTLLGDAPPSPGMTSEVLTFFRAEGLTRTGPGGGEDDEDITVQIVPRAALDGWLRDRQAAGLQIDMKLYAGLQLAEAGRG